MLELTSNGRNILKAVCEHDLVIEIYNTVNVVPIKPQLNVKSENPEIS